MRIRDALESDAETLAGVIDRPHGVVTDMIHDRSVRVAISEGNGNGTTGPNGSGTTDPNGSGTTDPNGDGVDEPTVEGFVAFDVRGETVHVTDFDGNESTVRRLFEEPRRFASREEMAVEVVVPNDERTGTVVEAAGFEAVGEGPQFEGRETTRYRIEADDLET